MKFQAIPIIRIFDEGKAKEFYLGFLGMRLDWEHRIEPDSSIYMQVSRGDPVFHLSEHSGDCTPGSKALPYLHVRLHRYVEGSEDGFLLQVAHSVGCRVLSTNARQPVVRFPNTRSFRLREFARGALRRLQGGSHRLLPGSTALHVPELRYGQRYCPPATRCGGDGQSVGRTAVMRHQVVASGLW
jgi:hypothetical protein